MGRRVLLVDRNPDSADTQAAVLRLHGLDAVVAYTCAAAEGAMATDWPDAAVLGLTLPDGNGCDLARRLRAVGKPLVLVALSGDGRPHVEADARAAGFDHFLRKPADPVALLKLLAGSA